jgi:hypothetical protein
VLSECTVEEDKQEGDSDDVTKDETETPKEAAANTVAKSLKCNEYVIMKHIQVGQEVMSPLFTVQVLFRVGPCLFLYHRRIVLNCWEV